MEREELAREMRRLKAAYDAKRKVPIQLTTGDELAAARAEGFREGLEAAAEWIENEVDQMRDGDEMTFMDVIEAIRALAPKKDDDNGK